VHAASAQQECALALVGVGHKAGEREEEGGDTTDLVDERSNEGAVWPAKPADTHTPPTRTLRHRAYQSERANLPPRPCSLRPAAPHRSEGQTTRLALGGHGRQHGRPGQHTVTGPPARQRPAVPCCLPSQGSRERPARRRCRQRARAATRRTHPSSTHREKGRRQGTQADGGPKESPARPQRRSPPSPHHRARLSPLSCFVLSSLAVQFL
jgi:hypothetical protein